MDLKIQILYAKSGFIGHKVIAENYTHLLRKQGCQVQSHDVFEVDDKRQVVIGNQLYLWGIQKVPWLWRILYFHWSRIPGADWLRTFALPQRFKLSQQLLLDAKADIIITTHPIATSVVNHLKATKKITAKLFTTFSDWHVQPFWLFPYVDKYFVPTQQHKVELKQMGYKEEQIEITGMLLNEAFYNAPSKEKARHLLDIPLDKKVILVMGGGRSWCAEELIAPLCQLRTAAYIIVVGASNERRVQIEQYIARRSIKPDNLRVTGFIETSVYLAAADLLVSKPGGLTTSEAFLLRVPLLSNSPLPGQEDANTAILRTHRSILSIDKNMDLVEYIDNLLTDQLLLQEVATKAHSLIPKNVPQIITELVSNSPYR